jgi:hypothetical protein
MCGLTGLFCPADENYPPLARRRHAGRDFTALRSAGLRHP